MTQRPLAVPPAQSWRNSGFTLVELAVVMFIIALLIGGMLMPLSAQQDIRARAETDKALTDARDALIGFALINGRLPCPASATSNGQESPPSGGLCTPGADFFPAASLGMPSLAADGYGYDGWGRESANRLRYAVTSTNSYAFTTENGMNGLVQPAGFSSSFTGDLVVCNTATGITATGCAPSVTPLTSNAIAVLYSLGKNAGTGPSSADETANTNGDTVFVSAPSGTNFDDNLIWISPSALAARLSAAGKP